MEIPIACTLTRGEMSDRRALWRRIDPAVKRRVRLHGRLEVVYAPTDEVERLLPSLVDAESRCCAFAEWRLIRGSDDVVLAIAGPDEGLSALAAEFNID